MWHSRKPTGENAPVQAAESPYGNMGEEILECHLTRTVDVFLRYFNLPAPTPQDYEFKDGEPHHWFLYHRNTIGKRTELNVRVRYSATALASEIHVIDIAKAHILAVQHLIDGKTRI